MTATGFLGKSIKFCQYGSSYNIIFTLKTRTRRIAVAHSTQYYHVVAISIRITVRTIILVIYKIITFFSLKEFEFAYLYAKHFQLHTRNSV